MSKTIDKKTISDELAQQVVEAAIARAKELDVVAVVEADTVERRE